MRLTSNAERHVRSTADFRWRQACGAAPFRISVGRSTYARLGVAYDLLG